MVVNNKTNQKLNSRAASVPVNIIMAYVIFAPEPSMPGAPYYGICYLCPEPSMPGAPYFIKQEVIKFLI